jgi:hypothetical protein
MDFAVLRQEFDAQVLAHLLPGFFGEFLFQFRQSSFGRADEVTDPGLALPQFGQHGFGGNAAVHHPDAFGVAVTFLNQLQHVPERGLVSGVAGEHFAGQRQALGRDDQRHDDLHAVAAFVPAVTEAAGIAFVFGHVAFKICRGQVVEQHVELRAKEIAPAPAQMGEEFVLVFQQTVEATIERVVLGEAFVRAQQTGAGGGGKPVAVQAPFAAGRKQPVKREQAQDFFPVRAFAAATQAGGKEGVELEIAPELIAQPARAPGAGAGELELRKLHLHRRRGGEGRGAVGGKERALAGLAIVFVEDGNGLLPGGALGIVDLTQVENVPLHHAAPDAAALDDGPGAMLPAVFFARAALEKHAPSVAPSPRVKRGWVATTRRWARETGGILRKSARRHREKSQITAPVAEVGLSTPLLILRI